MKRESTVGVILNRARKFFEENMKLSYKSSCTTKTDN